MNRWLYRTRQFLRGLTARIEPQERTHLTQVLSPAVFRLFDRLPLDAQRHSLNVLYTLQEAGYNDPDLHTAALLHDVGKAAADAAGVSINVWLRGPLVVLEEFAPDQLQRLARADDRTGWRYAVHVHLHHPAIGACWAQQAGCSELACWLIANHQTKADALQEQGEDAHRLELLRALQWADGRN